MQGTSVIYHFIELVELFQNITHTMPFGFSLGDLFLPNLGMPKKCQGQGQSLGNFFSSKVDKQLRLSIKNTYYYQI